MLDLDRFGDAPGGRGYIRFKENFKRIEQLETGNHQCCSPKSLGSLFARYHYLDSGTAPSVQSAADIQLRAM